MGGVYEQEKWEDIKNIYYNTRQLTSEISVMMQ